MKSEQHPTATTSEAPQPVNEARRPGSAKAKAKPRAAKPRQRKQTPGAKKKAAAVPSSKRRDRPSALAAAAQVLSNSGKPMRCKEIVQVLLNRGLWATKGKTPHATLHAAMIREIASQKGQARFRKTGRGLFAAAKQS